MEIEQRLLQRSESLTPAERRIAEAVLAAPQLVGFGTVAELAVASGVGTATVVRFATKLGYDGFSDLQQSVQTDLTGQLRPAVERIRDQRPETVDTLIGHHGAVESDNVRSTMDPLDPAVVGDVVERLADTDRSVLVLSGVASQGVALQFLGDLRQLRGGCELLGGSPVEIGRALALAGDGATVVAIDLRRYERWVIEALHLAKRRDAWVVALTDSVLSPLASNADRALVVSAAASGPFDSHVGTLALLNLLVTEVARATRADATLRLDRLEAAWHDANALTDR